MIWGQPTFRNHLCPGLTNLWSPFLGPFVRCTGGKSYTTWCCRKCVNFETITWGSLYQTMQFSGIHNLHCTHCVDPKTSQTSKIHRIRYKSTSESSTVVASVDHYFMIVQRPTRKSAFSARGQDGSTIWTKRGRRGTLIGESWGSRQGLWPSSQMFTVRCDSIHMRVDMCKISEPNNKIEK